MQPIWCYFLQQKSVARKKCAGCKISVHTMCMEQLEKVKDLWSLTESRSRLPLSSQCLLSLIRSILGANHHLENQDLELSERSVRWCLHYFVSLSNFNVIRVLNVVFQSNVVRHHWVHRRRQTGKCRQCGKVSLHHSLMSSLWRIQKSELSLFFCLDRDFNRSSHFTAKRLLPSAARGANRP